MLRLLNIEFHKLKHNRASRVLTIIYFALLTAIALIAMINFPFGDGVPLAEIGIFNFPYIWHFNTYVAAILKFFLLVVIVSMMANEYSNKTLKQNLIDGLSKKEFILSKFYTVIVFAAISTIFVFIISLILGYIYSDFTEFRIVFSDLEYLFAFFLKLTAFFSFGLFLGILVKRSAFAIGGMLVWFIAEWVIFGLLGWKLVSWQVAQSIKNFFPLEAMSNLIKEPGTRLNAVQSLAKQVGKDLSKDFSVQWQDVVITSIWIFIFIYCSYALLKKRDL
ncbi:ABC transporter permease subunit [Aureibaculum sp. 2210JD6-5]|uniref:ABC transporter permease n=1 Tax=Aureibaculum sp. 2210JD6-5 TaxID=3103957 RepID=UPI002AAE9CE3|nr:ABC transporter permease subunit [Aureibaculum sp. 2210JD6-5]MDY7396115.1 ABC transporter permease subunit [Aureibaculum sp. 2210JD6-5]